MRYRAAYKYSYLLVEILAALSIGLVIISLFFQQTHLQSNVAKSLIEPPSIWFYEELCGQWLHDILRQKHQYQKVGVRKWVWIADSTVLKMKMKNKDLRCQISIADNGLSNPTLYLLRFECLRNEQVVYERYFYLSPETFHTVFQ